MCIKTHKQETPISGDAAERPSQEPFVIPNPLRRVAFLIIPSELYTFLSLSEPPGLAPTPTGQRAPIDLITRPFSRLTDPTHSTSPSPRALVTLSSAYGGCCLLSSLVYILALFSFSYRPVRSLIPHRTSASEICCSSNAANADKRSAPWYRISRYSTNFPRPRSFLFPIGEQRRETVNLDLNSSCAYVSRSLCR